MTLKPMQETQDMWILSLGQEDPLEKDMATHSGILAWRIPWTEEPGVLPSMGPQRVDTIECVCVCVCVCVCTHIYT